MKNVVITFLLLCCSLTIIESLQLTWPNPGRQQHQIFGIGDELHNPDEDKSRSGGQNARKWNGNTLDNGREKAKITPGMEENRAIVKHQMYKLDGPNKKGVFHVGIRKGHDGVTTFSHYSTVQHVSDDSVTGPQGMPYWPPSPHKRFSGFPQNSGIIGPGLGGDGIYIGAGLGGMQNGQKWGRMQNGQKWGGMPNGQKWAKMPNEQEYGGIPIGHNLAGMPYGHNWGGMANGPQSFGLSQYYGQPTATNGRPGWVGIHGEPGTPGLTSMAGPPIQIQKQGKRKNGKPFNNGAAGQFGKGRNNNKNKNNGKGNSYNNGNKNNNGKRNSMNNGKGNSKNNGNKNYNGIGNRNKNEKKNNNGKGNSNNNEIDNDSSEELEE